MSSASLIPHHVTRDSPQSPPTRILMSGVGNDPLPGSVQRTVKGPC